MMMKRSMNQKKNSSQGSWTCAKVECGVLFLDVDQLHLDLLSKLKIDLCMIYVCDGTSVQLLETINKQRY